jgi:hypothetical protein
MKWWLFYMQQVSLFVKLRTLLDAGILSLQFDSGPESCQIFAGEGGYFYNGEKVEILADYTGTAPDGSEARYHEPHDIAWAPTSKTILASAVADTGPFELMPARLRSIVSKFKTKCKTSVN